MTRPEGMLSVRPEATRGRLRTASGRKQTQPVSFSPAPPTLCRECSPSRLLLVHSYSFSSRLQSVTSSVKSSPALPDRISIFLPLIYLGHFSHCLEMICSQASPMASNFSRTWLFLSFPQRGCTAGLLMESAVTWVDRSVRPGAITSYLCDLGRHTIPEAHDFHM